MAPIRLIIEDGVFKDSVGRQLVLRGINVAGDAKLPSAPEMPSHIAKDFFEGDKVTFHKRPFPKEDAHLHFSRLKKMGYNTIRYVFTWEAIEAAGPGKYDEEWIQHTVDILRIAKEYGFYVFMDPHQDVWSRFTGGSGAPMWTLYACGLNPEKFAVTEAAIVQNTYEDVDNFPKMIWSTNYFRLAAATMFTLFFAGRDFAPKCIIDGQNIQDYLQGHFLAAIGHLAKRIKEAGDLENDVVFGWESLNEPSKGMIGYQDISVIPKEQALKKGTSPTIFQAMLTGMGRSVEVDVWEMGGLGPVKSGRKLVDPGGEKAWLPADYDDSRYGWKRDPGWKLGECIWAQHGVWDASSENDVLLRKNYFAKNPRTGETIDYPCFSDSYFMDYFRANRDIVRKYHPDAIMLLQGPTMELPPNIKGTKDDDERMVYAPHFYDGITLMTKKWNRTWNVDVLGVLRGRYWHPAFAIRVGESAIRNCFRDQLAAMRQEGLDRVGDHPCILTEFGIPYDMDDKHAYKTGDYSSQSAAMDANHYGVEGALMEGYTLWVYMTENDHLRGDQWNGEDLSIVSQDDSLLPVSHRPKTIPDRATAPALRRVVTSSSIGAGEAPTSSANLSTASTDVPNQGQPRRSDVDQDDMVNPGNIKQVLTQPSISSRPASTNGHAGNSGNNETTANDGNTNTVGSSNSSPELSNAPGFRAAEAYVRPAPIATSGEIAEYGFNLRQAEFNLKVYGLSDEKRLAAAKKEAATLAADTPEGEEARRERSLVGADLISLNLAPGGEAAGGDDGNGGLLPLPTVVWLPEYHFPEDSIDVEVSAGRWEISWDAEETATLQRLRWWHPPGTQTLKIKGRVRKYNDVEGATGREDGYYDQLSNWLEGGCSVM
ncbi:glycoside hydrolase family 5 [Sporothrix brasiliensis 5110]|uniref:Glycoside hydrolase family 5 n=1 Tax=Sporothrix brasiliensis 5110 TaxID=1398154 RepID=A0A0C2III9_9PEZI|nr:glycoside hydrolase family 5 [Sporothrix brasiliensis 5110]KIH89001.1 glycoside hydrolase family 5 [Sporothrix brasiliensis 5110]